MSAELIKEPKNYQKVPDAVGQGRATVRRHCFHRPHCLPHAAQIADGRWRRFACGAGWAPHSWPMPPQTPAQLAPDSSALSALEMETRSADSRVPPDTPSASVMRSVGDFQEQPRSPRRHWLEEASAGSREQLAARTGPGPEWPESRMQGHRPAGAVGRPRHWELEASHALQAGFVESHARVVAEGLVMVEATLA